MKSTIKIRGKVTATVFDLYGNIIQQSVNHNIITNEGDAMVADILSGTGAITPVDNTNGYVEVGTGFVSALKTSTSCTTPTGSPEVMDSTYPKLKGTFESTDDNVVQYRATFDVGELNQSGINEVALLNNAVAASAECLAYAELDPIVNVTLSNYLRIDWELTFVGS